MAWEAWLTIIVIAVAVIMMVREWMDPALALCAAAGILLVSGVLTTERALGAFASPAVAVVAALLVMAGSLQRSRWAHWLTANILGNRGGRRGLARALPPIALLSAFLTNTTVVSVLTPAARRWAKEAAETPSKLLMPLSFASILGGTCTLVGTSTNLVVDDMLRASGNAGFTMFELGWVGVPMTLVGILFLVVIGYRLTPVHEDPLADVASHAREYFAGFRVRSDCDLVGKRVESIRHLQGLFLAGIERGDEFRSPVGPTEYIRAGDTLRFVGNMSMIAEIAAIEGLDATTDPVGGDRMLRMGNSQLVEAVVSPASPILRMNIRDARFRSRYNAVVLAVHRHGERVVGKVGDVVVRPGDTLLLLADPNFVPNWGHSRHFYLVSGGRQVTRQKLKVADWVEPLILGLVVAVAALGLLPLLHAAVGGVAALILLRRLTAPEMWAALHWPTLATIGGSIAIGYAVTDTGIAASFVSTLPVSEAVLPIVLIASLFLLTSIMSEVVTNVAAATLMFPLAQAMAGIEGVTLHTLALAIALGASTSFASPIGYHTNIMVAGPGNYRFVDFLKLGLPLKAVVLVVGILGVYLLTPGS